VHSTGEVHAAPGLPPKPSSTCTTRPPSHHTHTANATQSPRARAALQARTPTAGRPHWWCHSRRGSCSEVKAAMTAGKRDCCKENVPTLGSYPRLHMTSCTPASTNQFPAIIIAPCMWSGDCNNRPRPRPLIYMSSKSCESGLMLPAPCKACNITHPSIHIHSTNETMGRKFYRAAQ
jgi:hypothetical protein